MNLKLFLRNALMALAVSFVPKILQPVLPEVMEEKFNPMNYPVTYKGAIYWAFGNDEQGLPIQILNPLAHEDH